MRPDERLDAEIRHHLDLLAVEYEIRGMSPEEARYAAWRAFGNIAAMKDRHRDVRGVTPLTDLARDLREATGTLLRTIPVGTHSDGGDRCGLRTTHRASRIDPVVALQSK